MPVMLFENQRKESWFVDIPRPSSYYVFNEKFYCSPYLVILGSWSKVTIEFRFSAGENLKRTFGTKKEKDE